MLRGQVAIYHTEVCALGDGDGDWVDWGMVRFHWEEGQLQEEEKEREKHEGENLDLDQVDHSLAFSYSGSLWELPPGPVHCGICVVCVQRLGH